MLADYEQINTGSEKKLYIVTIVTIVTIVRMVV